MKRSIIVFGIILCFALTACGGQATPTVSPEDIRSTAQAAAFTVVAQTLAAIPTDTLLPPTATATSTPLPTDTPTFTPTLDPSLPTATSTIAPQTAAPTKQDDCNKILTGWKVPTIKFIVENETQPKGTIVLSMYVVTDLGECGFVPVYGSSFLGPEGYYSAGALVTGKKDLKVFGAFRAKGGSWSVVVRNDVIVAKGGCYPNC